jgi:hypothetical protein
MLGSLTMRTIPVSLFTQALSTLSPTDCAFAAAAAPSTASASPMLALMCKVLMVNAGQGYDGGMQAELVVSLLAEGLERLGG